MSYGLHAGSDGLKAAQSQQVEGYRPQRRHRPSSIAPVAMGVLIELGVTDPVPALNAPAVAHQLQHGFWGCAQAGEEEMGLPQGLAVAGPDGDHLHDPVDDTTMTLLENTGLNSDMAFPLKLASDLAMQCLLFGFHRQEEVGPLLGELLKNGFWVWSASAWISTPSRSSSPSNCFSTASSWFAPMA